MAPNVLEILMDSTADTAATSAPGGASGAKEYDIFLTYHKVGIHPLWQYHALHLLYAAATNPPYLLCTTTTNPPRLLSIAVDSVPDVLCSRPCDRILTRLIHLSSTTSRMHLHVLPDTCVPIRAATLPVVALRRLRGDRGGGAQLDSRVALAAGEVDGDPPSYAQLVRQGTDPRRLKERLVAAGFSVWIDADQPRDFSYVTSPPRGASRPPVSLLCAMACPAVLYMHAQLHALQRDMAAFFSLPLTIPLLVPSKRHACQPYLCWRPFLMQLICHGR